MYGRRKRNFKIRRRGRNKTVYRMYLFRYKIDQCGDNKTEIKHKISQTSKAVNALNSI